MDGYGSTRIDEGPRGDYAKAPVQQYPLVQGIAWDKQQSQDHVLHQLQAAKDRTSANQQAGCGKLREYQSVNIAGRVPHDPLHILEEVERDGDAHQKVRRDDRGTAILSDEDH